MPELVQLLFAFSAFSLFATLILAIGLAVKAAAMEAEQEFAAYTPEELALADGGAEDGLPLVSVIVPARNEERNLGPCLEGILGFDYPNLEVLLVDDESSDRTGELSRAAAEADPRVQAIELKSLPEREPREGYPSGKVYVLAEAARLAKGEWLLFLDADTRQQPAGLRRALTYARRHGLRAFSASGLYPNPGFWGEIAEATIYVAVFFAIPLRAVNDPARRDVGWANGQFVLIERRAYDEIGGHRALKPFATEDLALGRLLKEREIPYRFLPGAALYTCINYVGLAEAHAGWVRLIAQAGPWLQLRRSFFGLAAFYLLAAGVLPFLTLPAVACGLIPNVGVGPLSLLALAAAQVALALLIQSENRRAMRLPLWRSLLLPVGALLGLRTLFASYRARFSVGGYTWRGRSFTLDDPQALGAPEAETDPRQEGAA